MEKINVAILGYGNLGKGVEIGLKNAEDMNLVGVFTRRDPSTVKSETKAYHIDELANFKDKIDVLIMCGGSKSDIPEQGPIMAKDFNTVDSFDTHAKVPAYFDKMNEISLQNKKVSIISTGWDPGLFSINRVLAQAVLPQGETYTFWGKGVSQGHSDAVRRIKGVKDAKQYTIPNTELVEQIKNKNHVEYQNNTAHKREVFVVLENGSDQNEIERQIKTMPDYFADYETTVHFIDEQTMIKDHSGIPHGGEVLRLGQTGNEGKSLYGFSLDLTSNPEFTALVNIAFARAAYKLSKANQYGAKTVLDIPIAMLSKHDGEYLRAHML